MSADRYRGLKRYLAAACAARIAGDGVAIALVIVARAAGASPVTAGLLVAAWSGPSLVSGLVVGHRLDTSPRPRRFIVAAGFVAACALGADAALLGRVAAVLPVLATVAGGVTVPLFTGALSSLLPGLVAADSLGRAQALDSATYSVAAIAGPGTVALLATGWTARAALAVPAAAILAGVIALPVAPRRAVPATPGPRPSLSARVRALGHTRRLRDATLATTLAALGWGGLEIGAVGVAALIGAAHAAGLLLTVLGAAGLIAALGVSRRPLRDPDRAIPACLVAMTGGAGLIALAGSTPALVVAGFALFGAGDGVLLPATLAVRSRDAPPAMNATVFTTAASLKTAAGALGAAAAGGLAVAIGARGLFAALAATQLLAAAVALPGRRERPGGRRAA